MAASGWWKSPSRSRRSPACCCSTSRRPAWESHLILDVVAALDPDIAVLIIEHDMDVVFRFAKEITVLVQGAVFTHGTPDEIMNNEQVKAVYLGQERHHEGHRGGRHG